VIIATTVIDTNATTYIWNNKSYIISQ
jgi:hypothetical protein